MCRLVDGDAEFVLTMVECLGDCVGNMLDEGAAERDVEYLEAAANREDRKIESDRVLDQSDFEGIASRGDTVGFGMDCRCSVTGWIDVSSASQEESVDDCECVRWFEIQWQDEGKSTGSGHCGRVVEVELEPFGWANVRGCDAHFGGNADDRLFHGWAPPTYGA